MKINSALIEKIIPKKLIVFLWTIFVIYIYGLQNIYASQLESVSWKYLLAVFTVGFLIILPMPFFIIAYETVQLSTENHLEKTLKKKALFRTIIIINFIVMMLFIFLIMILSINRTYMFTYISGVWCAVAVVFSLLKLVIRSV